MSDSVRVFAEHAAHYDAQRRRLVPSFELFYGTAVDMLALRGGEIRRVLDLGAGTGLMSQAVIERYPGVELVLLDGADEMLSHARERLPPESITTITRDMRAELPAGPFDAVVSGLAIH
ncbi:MAG TPA: methyltransferase domain-containing protein, partial [Solirubrobacteraceae bacterium]|nr:methyltransferase domain-containing protein [Solirubrobacteraceae bacterium]